MATAPAPATEATQLLVLDALNQMITLLNALLVYAQTAQNAATAAAASNEAILTHLYQVARDLEAFNAQGTRRF